MIFFNYTAQCGREGNRERAWTNLRLHSLEYV